MESFLGTVWRHLYYPSLICQLVAPMPAMALFTSIGTCSPPHYPHFVQNSTCTLPMPPSVPCFWCRCSYSIICIPGWQSPHVPNCSVLMVHTRWQMVSRRYPRILPACCHGSGSVISWPLEGDSRKVCTNRIIMFSEPSVSISWQIRVRFFSCRAAVLLWCYPAMKCSAPRRQHAWLSVRLDSSLGFCLIRAPCFVWQQAGREVPYLLYSLNLWPGGWLSA